jgi:hypothetical protein
MRNWPPSRSHLESTLGGHRRPIPLRGCRYSRSDFRCQPKVRSSVAQSCSGGGARTLALRSLDNQKHRVRVRASRAHHEAPTRSPRYQRRTTQPGIDLQLVYDKLCDVLSHSLLYRERLGVRALLLWRTRGILSLPHALMTATIDASPHSSSVTQRVAARPRPR